MIPEWKYPRNCKICKKAFTPRQPNQVCCSKECSNENARIYAMEKRENVPKEKKSRKREKEEKMSISEINRIAREHGMSYGQYMALERMNRKKFT